MSRKKAAAYIAVIGMIIAAGIMMPYAIRWTSGFISGQVCRLFTKEAEPEESLFFREQNETESEYSTSGASDGGDMAGEETQIQAGVVMEDTKDIPATDSPSAIPFTYEDLTSYHDANRPEVTGNDEIYSSFIWDREEAFTNAVLNYLFAWYRASYRVDEIRLVKMDPEKDGILECEIELSLSQGENSGYAKLLCSYDKNKDVYTISPYSTAKEE